MATTSVKVPYPPPIAVTLDPEEGWDAKGRRALAKELRAAGWSGRRVIWAVPEQAKGAAFNQPLVAFRLDSAAPALDLLFSIRMGLSHLLHSLRKGFPGFEFRVTVSGRDGRLVLRWPVAASAGSSTQSMVGHVPASDKPSRGRDWWAERDGGIRFLAAGTWVWDEAERAWQPDTGTPGESRQE